MPDTAEPESLSRLVRTRGSQKAKVTLIKNYVLDIDTDADISPQIIFGLQSRLERLTDAYNEFLCTQLEIDVLFDKIPQAQAIERIDFENSYFDLESQLKYIISMHKTSTVTVASEGSASGTASSQVRLPKITLPNFSGKLEDWLEFRDTYESLIHANSAINNIEKFHYLRSSLSGDAALVVSSLEFTNRAYIEAWKLLCNRYNNPRLLIHNHVRSIFSFDVIYRESASKIRNMLDTLSKHLAALTILKEPTHQWDTLIVYIVSSKLDAVTSREWEEDQLSAGGQSTLKHLISFLENKANVLESVSMKRADKPSTNNNNNRHKSPPQVSRSLTSTNAISCSFCKDAHSITNCEAFLKLSVDNRFNQAKSRNLCLNCLRSGHQSFQCKSTLCRKCGRKHNTLLHFDNARTNLNVNAQAIEIGQPSTSTGMQDSNEIVASTCETNCEQVVLATALVSVFDIFGRTHNIRALLDSASQSSFVTQDVVDRLGLPSTLTDITITGIKQCKSTVQSMCRINVQSLRSKFSISPTVLVVPTITNDLPSTFINRSKLNIPKHLCLADPQFYKPQKIDLLLGADCFWELLSIGQHCLGPGLPIMQKTRLGWIISGRLLNHTKQVTCNLSRNCLIESQIALFWELEEFPDKKLYSTEENQCESHFVSTTERGDNGRFIVKLPLKHIDTLGESFDIARKRFLSLERKLRNHTVLRDQYFKFILDYINLGHMVKVTNGASLNIQPHFYLPHHAVCNANSTTTRLRVVFDGSSQTSTGVSLNDCQVVGPVIQDDLFSILLRFRRYQYVVTADVAKMYRQVLVHHTHKPLQRILWRFDSLANIDTYELQTVTYGTASASFLSIRCLHALAQEIEQTYPHIAHRIKNDFYVDDLITGADSIEALNQICSIITRTLSSGCFELHKWRSNCSSIVEELDKPPSSSLSFDSQTSSKTLGLLWCSLYDRFSFEISAASCVPVTKRTILSRISQIFDPLGLLAPCTITGKIILQRLWLEKLSWDSSVPASIHSEWLSFNSSLAQLNQIFIPRCVFAASDSISTQLHGFSDASELAYGACLYIRSTSTHGLTNCRLLCAKTRVAPLKSVSIPRLELCAATLLAKLTKKVLLSTEITFDEIYLWSDSTVVLGWLKLPPHKLTTFVSNRVSKIQGLSQVKAWRHVPTKANPADLLSRGVRPVDIINHTLWWSGPDWLVQPLETWPQLEVGNAVLPELRPIKITEHTFVAAVSSPLINFANYSSITRLIRIIAYIFRFVNNLKKRIIPTHNFLLSRELNDAEMFIIKSIQSESFSDDIEKLKASRPLPQNSRIVPLSPFLDADALLRVGGRLDNSHFSYNQRHPLLLPKHHITKLIFVREHLRLLHVGPLGLLNSVRLKYWPLSGRSIAKHTVYHCKVCFRAKPAPFAPPTMGNLPTARVTPSLPFSHCGVDYAGPVELKISHLRNAKTYKAYIALFVCLSTKAVHLELVTSLSTDAFIAALRRFCSRRGAPSHVYSDNGTNFVGASREIALFFRTNADDIISGCAGEQVHWHFIPPHSPNFGGLWEAGVKAVKHHLKRVVGTQTLTYEQYSTFLVQVEAILNSRPLSPLSSDPNDFVPLTPGHFLIGRALTTILDDDLQHLPTNRLSKFELIQSAVQCFWKRWKCEYVNTLQQKTRWTKDRKDKPALGQIVILVDDNAPMMRWTLGRIVELHPGRDALVRVVSVRTATGTFKRAITKLCPLPLDEEDRDATPQQRSIAV